MPKQKIKTPLKYKLLKFAELLLVFLFAVFIAVFMAFHYEDIGYFPSVVLIIVAVVLFFPKFLRRNLGTDKMKDIGGAYHQEKIGSFLLTRADENGFYPYREFNSIFFFFSPIKYSRRQHISKIYYIDLKAKCLIGLVHILLCAGFILGLSKISKIEDHLLSIVMILIFMIMFFQFFDIIRNYLIKKLARNSNPYPTKS